MADVRPVEIIGVDNTHYDLKVRLTMDEDSCEACVVDEGCNCIDEAGSILGYGYLDEFKCGCGYTADKKFKAVDCSYAENIVIAIASKKTNGKAYYKIDYDLKDSEFIKDHDCHYAGLGIVVCNTKIKYKKQPRKHFQVSF